MSWEKGSKLKATMKRKKQKTEEKAGRRGREFLGLNARAMGSFGAFQEQKRETEGTARYTSVQLWAIMPQRQAGQG
ncbi:hypothetical protein N7454_002459 [Penicillium verhagenii]|nr:hypothetical protein N7454_002459 [Penicillium verhagenii]